MGFENASLTSATGGAALPVVNMADYQAPAAVYFDGVSNATTTFTSATANFTSSDVGKWIRIEKGGASQFRSFITTISAVTSSTTVTLAAAVPRAGNQTKLVFYVARSGLADAAFTSAVAASYALGGARIIYQGWYAKQSPVVLLDQVYLDGTSRRGSGLFYINNVPLLWPMVYNDFTSQNGAQACGVVNMSLDGNSTGNNHATTTLAGNYTAGAGTCDVTSSALALPAGFVKVANGGTVNYLYYGGITVGGGVGGSDQLINVVDAQQGFASVSVTAAGSTVTFLTGCGIFTGTQPYANIPTFAQEHDPYHLVDNVEIMRCEGYGVLSTSQSETRWSNIRVYSCEQMNFSFGFDTWFYNLTSDSAGYAGLNWRNGIGTGSCLKSFSSGTVDNTRGPGFLIQGPTSIEEGSLILTGLVSQDNQSEGFKCVNAQRVVLSGVASSNSLGTPGTYPALLTDGCTNGFFDITSTQSGTHGTGADQLNALKTLSTNVTNQKNFYRISHAASASGTVGQAVVAGSVVVGNTLAVNGRDWFNGYDWGLDAYGVQGASGRPEDGTSTFQPANGVAYYTQCRISQDFTLANVIINISTGFSGGGGANMFVGIYDSTGTRQGVSAEQSASWATGGNKTVAITLDAGKSLALTTGSFIWVGFLVGTQSATPGLLRTLGTASGTLLNVNLGASNLRIGSAGAGLSALPATVTPSGMSGSLSSGPFFCFLTT